MSTHNQSKLPHIETTIFSVMSALAKQHNAINLSQGFPNFKSDETLMQLVTKAMRDGYNQYAPMPGNMSLREAIAHKMDRLYGNSYNPETEITVTAGATQAIFTIISAFVKQDDEVIMFRPAYDCYEPAIVLQGGKPISVQLEHPNYTIDWNKVKALITSKTRMIIINTPHNPSGTVLSTNDMQMLESLTKNTNILVLSDEVYEHIIFDDIKHQSACRFPDLKTRSFVVASFGKTFHNTGWKIGYCCGPKDLMEEFRKVHQFNVFSVHHPSQKALADYLQEPSHYEALAEFYQSKRDYFLKLIDKSRFDFTPSKGTYFQVLEFHNITKERDVDFAKRLTIDHGIASIPMSGFNQDKTDFGVLRFCFAKTNEILEQAAEILNAI